MPGYEARILGLLDEKGTRPAQQIRSQQIFDRVQNARVENEVPEPREQQMRLVAQMSRQGSAGMLFMAFEAGP